MWVTITHFKEGAAGERRKDDSYAMVKSLKNKA
jgi:hypothetical protein